MSQEAFIYSFVARGTTILAEYTEFTGNFPAIAAQCLQKLTSSNNKFTYNCDHHTFNFLVEDGYGLWKVKPNLEVKVGRSSKISIKWDPIPNIKVTPNAITISDANKVTTVVCSSIIYQFLAVTKANEALFLLLPRSVTLEALSTWLSLYAVYCVVAKDSVGKQISIAFLERMKVDFKKRYGGGKADTAMAKSLNKEFGPVLKEHKKYIIEHAEEIEKLLKVKAQVSEVKSIMLENIDKRAPLVTCCVYMTFNSTSQAIDRGESLTTLADKTENLHDQAQAYKNQGTKIRRKMWYQNMKIKMVVLGILLLLVLVIWVSVCHGFDCSN
ncbi:hypothetical protein Godav_016581 [Gossypium davidsonii]|uniref:Longin domain-containing protein n=1 Tax=Gossypium davidsonii TaxID=34287 RepID=A0A7J8RRU1_GOSDV|nr:hypothetical protein [Gossypium davidsonii]